MKAIVLHFNLMLFVYQYSANDVFSCIAFIRNESGYNRIRTGRVKFKIFWRGSICRIILCTNLNSQFTDSVNNCEISDVQPVATFNKFYYQKLRESCLPKHVRKTITTTQTQKGLNENEMKREAKGEN